MSISRLAIRSSRLPLASQASITRSQRCGSDTSSPAAMNNISPWDNPTRWLRCAPMPRLFGLRFRTMRFGPLYLPAALTISAQVLSLEASSEITTSSGV